MVMANSFVAAERKYKGAEYDFKVRIEPWHTDHFVNTGKVMVSIYRSNSKVNKIIQRFSIPIEQAGVLLEAFDAANVSPEKEA